MDNAQEFASGAMEDFETYMMIARQGGTKSKLREPNMIDSEQDIKMTAVQNVSIIILFIFLTLFNFNYSK
tara:strand:+ start:3565 stop:3774 length:210 start_codon:yes stop_codon:yes gene_type:complete